MKLDACRKKVDLRVIYAGLCSDGKKTTTVKAGEPLCCEKKPTWIFHEHFYNDLEKLSRNCLSYSIIKSEPYSEPSLKKLLFCKVRSVQQRLQKWYMGHFGVVQAKQKLSLFVPFLYLVLKVVAELLLSEPGRKSYRWIGGKK